MSDHPRGWTPGPSSEHPAPPAFEALANPSNHHGATTYDELRRRPPIGARPPAAVSISIEDRERLIQRANRALHASLIECCRLSNDAPSPVAQQLLVTALRQFVLFGAYYKTASPTSCELQLYPRINAVLESELDALTESMERALSDYQQLSASILLYFSEFIPDNPNPPPGSAPPELAFLTKILSSAHKEIANLRSVISKAAAWADGVKP